MSNSMMRGEAMLYGKIRDELEFRHAELATEVASPEKISVQTRSLPSSASPFDQLELRVVCKSFAKQLCKIAIDLNGNHFSRAREKFFGQRPRAGSDFDHRIVAAEISPASADQPDEVLVNHEILPEAFARFCAGFCQQSLDLRFSLGHRLAASVSGDRDISRAVSIAHCAVDSDCPYKALRYAQDITTKNMRRSALPHRSYGIDGLRVSDEDAGADVRDADRRLAGVLADESIRRQDG